MYRRIHGGIEPRKVAQFLILDRDFPRSVRFCLMGAQHSVNQITGSPPGTFPWKTERLLGKLRSDFEYASIDEIVTGGLHEFIDNTQVRINEIGEAIQQDFFTVHVQNQSIIAEASA